MGDGAETGMTTLSMKDGDEQIQRLILDSMAEAVVAADAGGRLIRFNKAAERLLGQWSSEAPPEGWGVHYGVFLPDGCTPCPPDQIPLIRALRGELPHNVELYIKRPDGSGSPVTATGRPILDEQGGIIGGVVVFSDISVSRLAESVLRKWAKVFECANWGVVIGSADTQTLEMMNSAFARMHGYTLEELTGRPILEVFAPAVRAEALRQIAIARERVHHRFESLHLRCDGSVFPVLIDVTTVRDDEGLVQFRVINVQDMSEQKRVEQELRSSEALLRNVLDALPVGVWTADREGRITHGNPAGRRIWGGEKCGGLEQGGEYKGWLAATGKRLRQEDRALVRALKEGETVLGELVEIECADGAHKVILNSAVPLRDSLQCITGAIVIDEDITERYHAQETVRVNREFFQSVFDSAAVGMALCDPQGRFLGVNQAMCRTFGYSDEELLTMSVQDITHPDDLEQSARNLQRVLQGVSSSFQMEKRYLHKSGAELWVLVAVALVRDGHGAPLYFIGQVLDITARREAEDKLRESQANLASAQAQAHLGSWWLDIRNDVLNWSDENYRIFGVEKGTALDYQSFLDCVHPDDRERVDQAWQAGMRGEPYDIQHRIVVDGRVKWVRERAELEFDAEGRLLRGIGTTQDITELKAHEEELVESKERLRKLAAHQEMIREEERARIAREVHDELGQLLTALKMDVSLLRLRFGEAPALLAQADGMRQLVEKTISVVRHIASNLRPAALNLGIVPALEWLAEDFTQHSTIPCELLIEDMELALDDTQATAVFRVVQESLTNVARHAQASLVEIRLWCEDGNLHARVQDNGRGFDSANRKRNTFGLLGIRERVLMLDGVVRINNTPGSGACVAISIPLLQRRAQ